MFKVVVVVARRDCTKGKGTMFEDLKIQEFKDLMI